jgi:AmmeMemoRadiSam system protein B
MHIRKPAVAGQFYPGDEEHLKEEVKSLITEDIKYEKAIAAICPHAGYMYSGKVAGAVYSKLKKPDTFIIIGPNHTGYGKEVAISGAKFWRTPLGDVEVDKELGSILGKKHKLIKEDNLSHLYEHSLEVQIPFLQVKFKEAFKILPITIKEVDLGIYRELGKALAEAIKEYPKEILIIASNDMTHFKPDNIAREEDNQAIEAILKLDEGLLYQRVTKMNITMCGTAPVCVTLKAAVELGASSAELIDYKTSADAADISKDYSSVVGYAGIIIK